MRLELFTTFGSGGKNFHQVASFVPDPGEEDSVVNLYPEETYETLEGFGGAMTESAAYVYSRMDEAQKKRLLEACFSPERMNYQFVRLHLDSCDFSLEQYEAMSDPGDTAMNSFSLERMERYVLPMLRDAQKAAGRPLELMLSPWSPPAFMKTNGRREGGGKLKPEYRQFWAEYLCRYILELKNRGFHIRRMTLQNEPKAVQTWDSCVFTAKEQRDFLVDCMVPAMAAHGLEDIEIFLWDHNKERAYEWMREAVDPVSDPMIAGAAFHWYSGDHFEVLDLIRRRFPGKKLISSESCIEFCKYDPRDAVRAAQSVAHELIGDLNHGMTAFYDWNLLLDENGGPNYVENFCLAPFLYDMKTGKLVPQLLQQYFEKFSHYLLPGSVRVGHSRYTEELEVTAWRRPDGALAVILLNRTGSPMPVCLRLDGQLAQCLLYPQSITAGIIS